MVASEWNPANGGISAFNQSLCEAAVKAGASVTCIVPSFSERECIDASAKGVTLAAPKPSPGVTGIPLLQRGLTYAASFDAIIGHGRITGGVATVLRDDKYPDAKYVHFLHMDSKIIEFEKPTRDDAPPSTTLRQRTGIEIALAESADLVYAVGPQLARSFRAYLMKSGRDVTEFRPGLWDCDVASKPVGGMECLLFGRVEDYELKGVDLAAKALGVLASERAAEFDVLRFIVRGAKPNEAIELRNRILKESQALAVVVEEFVPDRAEMSRAILGASLVLMPSKTEGFGLEHRSV
jgi:glycosyltransferase involved in cell wall biosynthesis